MNMSEYIVEMKHITKRFPGIVANDDVTIQIKRERSLPFWEKMVQEIHLDEYAVRNVRTG